MINNHVKVVIKNILKKCSVSLLQLLIDMIKKREKFRMIEKYFSFIYKFVFIY